MLESIIALIVPVLLPAAGTLVTTLVSYGTLLFTRFIKEKTKNEKVEAALTRVSHTAETVVSTLTQTMARDMRKAAEDGKLTRDDMSRLKESALHDVQRIVPDLILSNAKLGVTCLETFIGSKIEQAVLKGKGA